MPNSTPQPTNQEEEIVEVDDAIIGRVFRWSLFAIILIAIAVGATFYFTRVSPEIVATKVTKLVAPAPVVAAGEAPMAKFTNVTQDAGITFTHNNGAYGGKLLPETMGAGVAFFDADADGDEDLLFVNGTYWPDHLPEGKTPTTSALYLNDGHGHFTDATAGSGLDVPIYGMGATTGDYDNDGRIDVYLSAVGGNRLFHNEGGGKFRDVTAAAGVGGAPDGWSSGAVWFDYDNDGRLDLFVCNYVRWSEEIDREVGYSLTGVGRAYGPPMNFQGAFPALYHNDGEGRFTDVSEKAGVQIKNPATNVPVGKSLAVAAVDLDGDHFLDLVIANDTVQNFVFHNRKDGTFEEIGALSGIAFDSYGNARGAMGIDTAHYRNDDTLGIAIGNFANEMTALYASQAQPLTFTDEAISEGIGPASRLFLKFGLFFFDYDLDGWLDLLSVNGHLEEEIGQVQASQTYAQPAQLFWNAGVAEAQAFVPVTAKQAGPDLFTPIVGRASAFADIDGDGDLDVVLTQAAGSPLLLRNDQALGHHWLRFKLRGTKANRDGLGALVKVTAGGKTQTRQVNSTRSYLSSSEMPVTFGLGANDTVESVEVVWPDGTVQAVKDWKLDAMNVVEQAP